MRARCERHALAIGPSGCLICRREQVGPAPAPAEGAAPADTAGSAPPAARGPSAAPSAPALASSAPTLPDGPAPAAKPAHSDSAPTAPTVTDAPEVLRVSIRVPPYVLLVSVVALAALLLVAYRPGGEGGESTPIQDEAARAALDPAPLAKTRADVAEPVLDEAAAPAEASATVAVSTAELERSREQALRSAERLEIARSRVKVVLYSTERCTRCTEARNHLVAQGIRPTERDIDKDARARARHRALSRKGGLPTIEVDGKVLVGFQPERIDRAVERAAALRLKRER